AWMGWSPAYARQRRGGKILQKSGRLAASITQYSTNDDATVGTNVKYARIHQEGGEISIPARSQKAYYRQNKDGSVGNRFVKKSRSNFE
ncbi:phage virion morphogenesis protein, partial [Enterobacter asburiae]